MEYRGAYLGLSDKLREQIKAEPVARKRKGLGAVDREPLEVPKSGDLQSRYMTMVKSIFPEKEKPRQEEIKTYLGEGMGDSDLAPSKSSSHKARPIRVEDMDERELLAKTLQAEAGNQGYKGKLAVGEVIANRVGSGRWGDSLESVIMAPGQFSAWNSVTGYAGGEQGQDMNKMRPSKEAYKAADAILSGSYKPITGGALNYYAIIPGISEKPKWSNDSFIKIGDHYFGKA